MSAPIARTLTAGQARRVAVAAQGLGRRPAGRVTMAHLAGVLDRTGLLQIDSVNVLARAHLLPVYSRLGPYDTALLDRAAAQAPRRLVEFWAHEASFVPPGTHHLLRWRMEEYRERDHWGRERDHNPGVLDAVRAVVTDRGPVTATEVHAAVGVGHRPKDGWGWNWTPAKHALEHLFNIGEITPARRTPQFERAYDLTTRVMPPEVLARPTLPRADAVRELVAISARALGIATARAAADYFRLSGADATRAVAELVEAGVLEPVAVQGLARPAYLHTAARLPRTVRARTLLGPFDPLVFERRRLHDLFGMHYRIGIYTPAAQRTHGYYVLPFLLGEHLVARVDLKADRKAGLLRVRAAHAEDPAGVPGVPRTGAAAWPVRDVVARELAAELTDMARWLGLPAVVVDDDAAGDLVRDLAPRVAAAS